MQQIRELIERLNADATQVTSEELAEARAAIREQRDHLANQEISDEVVAAAQELLDSFTAIKTVQEERAAATSELDDKRRGLLGEIKDSEPAEKPAESPPAEGDEPASPAPEENPSATEPPLGTEQPAEQPAEGNPDSGQVAVAASAKPVPRRASIGTFKTSQPKPPQNEQIVARTVVTAAGSSPSFSTGQQIGTTAQLAQMFAERLRSVMTGSRNGGDQKIYVANAVTQYPEARLLRQADWAGNYTKIEDATSPTVLTAAGGLCAPLQPLYDVEVIGSSARPVRDALAPFGVDRGGIMYRPPSSAAAALMDATTVWTVAQDAVAEQTGDTKGCFSVVCPAVEEAVIYAVSLCLKFSNITARFDPESTAANVRQGLIAHARRAENELLRAIQAECKLLSAVKVLGATRDILANIDRTSAYYRQRHRIDMPLTLTSIMPAWVRYLMRTDIARQMAAGDWMQALGVADAMIDGWFRNRGINPVWHLDGDIGGTNEVQTITITGAPTGGTYTLTFGGYTTDPIPYNATAADVRNALAELANINYTDITTAGGPHPGTAITVAFSGQYEAENVPQMTTTGSFTGGTSPAIAVTTTTTSSTGSTVNNVSIASQVYAEVAAGQPIPGYPNQVDCLMFTTGGFLWLDGGTLDLGLVRDSALNAQNRYQQFSETFEGIANRTVEPLRLVMTVQPTGQTAGTADTSAVAD